MPTPFDPRPWIEFPHDYAKTGPPGPQDKPESSPPGQVPEPPQAVPHAMPQTPPPPDLAAEPIAALPPLLKQKEVLSLMRVRMAVLRHLWLTDRFPWPIVLNKRL